jgi:tRNA(Arg) A34 adenosine deaminase TadA
MPFEPRFMERAIEISRQAIGREGTEPFGAVVVLDREIIGEGLNSAGLKLDPTAHGEVEAIRAASRNVGRLSLAGAELYTSCEPCPLCVAVSVVAGIGKVYYAASICQAIEALGTLPEGRMHPIDVEQVRRAASLRAGGVLLGAEQQMADLGAESVRLWCESMI